MDHFETLKSQLREQLEQISGFVARLENWARCYKDRGSHRGHCRSLEHNYKSPQCWHPEEPKIPVDEIDASLVERTFAHLPWWVRVAMAAHYIYGGRWPSNDFVRRAACRDLRCHRSQYSERVELSEKMLSNRLQLTGKRIRIT